jgi:hypothetical protein
VNIADMMTNPAHWSPEQKILKELEKHTSLLSAMIELLKTLYPNVQPVQLHTFEAPELTEEEIKSVLLSTSPAAVVNTKQAPRNKKDKR